MAEENAVTTTENGTGAETQDTRTFTQAELNAIVQDRLNRERGKYADYDTLKEKASKWDAAEEEGKTELQKAQDQAAALQKQVDAYKKSESLRTIREKVSQETGVPADLLWGETEDACKAQAQGILKYAKPDAYPEVKDGGSPGKKSEGSTRDLFTSYFNSLMK